MEKINGYGLNIIEKNIARLKELFPECVSDGKVNFDILKNILGDKIDVSDEKYSFTWNGKNEALHESQVPSLSTLVPCKDKSVNWNETENLFIEGDNLEVLKTLSKTYHGKIKLIFIDPPYNTGSDFIYPDNYNESLENYLNVTSQTTRANPEYSGRFHTDWLNLMYSRLKIARELLSEDGAIFISIDYNEFANLKKIMDEIFGENNFQREIIWRIGWLSGYKTTAPNFIRNHDTILFYSKSASQLSFNKKYIENKDFKELVKKEPKIKAKMESLGLNSKQQDELLDFINHGNRPERYPIEDTWNCNEYDDLNSIAIVSFSGEKISKILDIDQDFKGQKSIKMLSRIIESITNDGDIVMDFFAGTSSTAHAVLQLNLEQKTNRKFIMVQLPELCEEGTAACEAGYKTICDLSEERIRRVGKKLNFTDNSLPNLFDENQFKLDYGFKVFKLESSNIKAWDPSIKLDENTIFSEQETIKEDRSNLDVAYEIMLKYGVFNMPLEEVTINNKPMFNVGNGFLIIDLNNEITLQDVEAIGKEKPHCVVFKESGFGTNDNVKLNTVKTLQTFGVEDIKCL